MVRPYKTLYKLGFEGSSFGLVTANISGVGYMFFLIFTLSHPTAHFGILFELGRVISAHDHPKGDVQRLYTYG